MKFRFSFGVILACGRREPTLKTHIALREEYTLSAAFRSTL